jgi:type II secretory pathway component PulF
MFDENVVSNLLLGGLAFISIGAAVLLSWNIIGGVRTSPNDAMGLLLRVVGWVLLALGSLGVCMASLPLGLGLVSWFAVLVVLCMTINRQRVQQRKTLLRMLSLAATRGLPLSATARAFGEEAEGNVNHQARRLAQSLDAGLALPEAMATVHGLASRRTRSLIRLGRHTGTLRESLAEASNDAQEVGLMGEWVSHFLYFCGLLFVGSSVLLFVMVKIVPAFEQIFEDFNTELPDITQVLIDVSDLMVNYGVLLLPFMVLLQGLFLYSVLLYLGWIEGDLPLVERLKWPLDAALVLRALALVVEAGRPLQEAVAVLANDFPNGSVRGALYRAGRSIDQGVDWRDGLEQAGLLRRVDAALLYAAERAGNLPWALRLVAEGNQRRAAAWLRAILQFVSPLAMLGFGMVVAFVVTALFMPLIKILETLT